MCARSQDIDGCIRRSGRWHTMRSLMLGKVKSGLGKLRLGLKLQEFKTSHFDTLFTPLSFQAMPFTGKYQSVEIYYSG